MKESCSCHGVEHHPTGVDRRSFLKAAAAGAVTLSPLGSALPVMAGPFEDNEYLKMIAQDKRLDPAWVRSLFERGRKDVYSQPVALTHIGMPVGGLFAGTVYLGGDGRLWLWDIFNRDQEGIAPRDGGRTVEFRGKMQPLNTRWGLNYLSPAPPDSPFAQGFTLQVADQTRALDRTGFAEVSFEGRYPIGRVTYQDAQCPVAVELEAFSPFLPLNLDDSSLPATVMSFRLTNRSQQTVAATLSGFLENPICLRSGKQLPGTRHNQIVAEGERTALFCSATDEVQDLEKAARSGTPLRERHDFGTMALLLLGRADAATASTASSPEGQAAAGTLQESLVGRLERAVHLPPGKTATVTFALTWHFPNFYSRGCGNRLVGHHYAARFDSALAVARYLADHFERLAGETRRWVDTWYDSTLPYWLLDRAMANTSTLATTTCYRFRDGRFWAWEGIGCCPGTCTHVWHYTQAPGRLFPELERLERERVNFGLGLHDDGGIGMRTNLTGSNGPADDGQCGRILGVLREHQMSADDAFLRRLWPKVRQAIEFMIRRDGNADGILEGAQPNTLDAAWYGKISFISSLYLAALRAGQQMALEVGDEAFAKRCQDIADRGAKNILDTFNGEYFIQIEDPKYTQTIGAGNGCYIDQIFGQTWAHWVGLGRLFDRDKQLSALRALWKYNFVPDIGPFRQQFKPGRWYATAGDAGLVMCTWPKGGKREDWAKQWQSMYFNECMSGFEYQAAAHMVWEGLDQPDLLQDGLAVARAIHDRYNGALRNPYNEIECSDHYARAMASFGVYQAACGYEYHGPKGRLGFAPRLSPQDFRCAFTAAEGWGTFSQQSEAGAQKAEVRVKWGTLRLETLSLELPAGRTAVQVRVTVAGQESPATLEVQGRRVQVHLEREVRLELGQSLVAVMT